MGGGGSVPAGGIDQYVKDRHSDSWFTYRAALMDRYIISSALLGNNRDLNPFGTGVPVGDVSVHLTTDSERAQLHSPFAIAAFLRGSNAIQYTPNEVPIRAAMEANALFGALSEVQYKGAQDIGYFMPDAFSGEIVTGQSGGVVQKSNFLSAWLSNIPTNTINDLADVNEAIRTSALATLRTILPQNADETFVESVNQAITQANRVFLDSAKDSEAMQLYESEVKQDHLNAMTRLSAGMGNAGAANSSALIVGLAILEEGHNKNLSRARTDLVNKNYNQVFLQILGNLQQFKQAEIQAFLSIYTPNLEAHATRLIEAEADRQEQISMANTMLHQQLALRIQTSVGVNLQRFENEKLLLAFDRESLEFNINLKKQYEDFIFKTIYEPMLQGVATVTGGMIPYKDAPSKVGGVLSGAASGAAAGSVIPGVGTAIGGIVGGIAGAFS